MTRQPRFDECRQGMLKEELVRAMRAESSSTNTYEMVSRTVA